MPAQAITLAELNTLLEEYVLIIQRQRDLTTNKLNELKDKLKQNPQDEENIKEEVNFELAKFGRLNEEIVENIKLIQQEVERIKNGS